MSAALVRVSENGKDWTTRPATAIWFGHTSGLFDYAGAGWRYSNTNYVVAATLIEKLTGGSYADGAGEGPSSQANTSCW